MEESLIYINSDNLAFGLTMAIGGLGPGIGIGIIAGKGFP